MTIPTSPENTSATDLSTGGEYHLRETATRDRHVADCLEHDLFQSVGLSIAVVEEVVGRIARLRAAADESMAIIRKARGGE